MRRVVDHLSLGERLLAVALGLVVTLAILVAVTILSGERENAVDSVLVNCRNTEQLKRYTRVTAIETNRLRQRLSYLTAPEKAAYAAQLRTTLRRFRPIDCGHLPIVRSTR